MLPPNRKVASKIGANINNKKYTNYKLNSF